MIGDIPTLISGNGSKKAFLFVHGLCGNKEESLRFAKIAGAAGYDTVAIDLPGHGERKDIGRLVPWDVIPEIKAVYRYMKGSYDEISLRAVSIGAYFSLCALGDEKLWKCLLSSPLIDMVDMISGMMISAGVDEEELREKGEIQTSGQTLSWDYLEWARANKVELHCHGEMLYGSRDKIIRREVIDRFVENKDCELTVIDSEHWIHTPEAVAKMEEWEAAKI